MEFPQGLGKRVTTGDFIVPYGLTTLNEPKSKGVATD